MITERVTEEEPVENPNPEEEEEEEKWDDTAHRNEIANAKPTDLSGLREQLDNLEITVPDVPQIDFSDPNQIYAQIPIALDATKYIYNTVNNRLETIAKFSKEVYDKYSQDFDAIVAKYPEPLTDEQKAQKESEIYALNNDYMDRSYMIAKDIDALKNEEKVETGFIGDVYIDGKLNNRAVEDYVLREELDDKADVDQYQAAGKLCYFLLYAERIVLHLR